MMAKNLKHLEYLKYHNPDTTLPATKESFSRLVDGLFHIHQYQTIPHSHFDQEYYENITPNIRLFHLYKEIKGDFYMA